MDLDRLSSTFLNRYREIQEQHSLDPFETERNWYGIMKSLGIRPLRWHENFSGRCVLEDLGLVMIVDPCSSGDWLEITEETARKILVLGIP